MTNTEKAYIAGIVDGEGSIMLTRFHKNQYHSPCVSISSTDLELLEWIKNTIKSGKITNKKNYNEERHKDSYTYTIIYDEAIQFLQSIEPYLVIEKKKARARHIITKYKEVTIRNGSYNDIQKLAKEQFYIDFIAL
ncbi:LAGLIDADG family homing endonuclease [Tissierella sp.]|uniref:LAGLIDADG family homing endonuclease n=1 Tax=Tissierella sp. TaxID=41274 RepID=UPI00286626CE|nr:LAGLIDADG family homing endonuclease [Tissierella sp.]MDR7855740.1 LAGLIDADG family homing endonuclease [Tissierella sp.]